MSANKAAKAVLHVCINIIVISLVIIGIYACGKAAFDFGISIFTEQAVDREPGRDIPVLIPEGAGSKKIAELLESKGLIENSTVFLIKLKLSPYENKLKPGSYILNTSRTQEELMRRLTQTEEEAEKEAEKKAEEEALE